MDEKRIATGVLIGGILAVLFCLIPAGSPLCLVVLLAVCGLAAWEFYTLLAAGGIRSSRKWGTSIGLVFAASSWFCTLESNATAAHRVSPDDILWSIMAGAIFFTFCRLLGFSGKRAGLDSSLGTLLGFMYIPFLWSFLIRIFLSGDPSRPAWAAFYLLLCTKLSDAGGYFIGSRFGRRKIAFTISPQKSWEGLGGGFLFCLATNLLWLLLSDKRIGGYSFNIVHAVALSILFPIVGTIGDLVESLFKRAVEIKDSNTLAYGIGGILDMIDSILFTAPMFFIYLEFLLA